MYLKTNLQKEPLNKEFDCVSPYGILGQNNVAVYT